MMKTPQTLGIIACAVVAAVFVTIAACDGDNASSPEGGTSSSGGPEGSSSGTSGGTLPDGGKPTCFSGTPKTHLELMNACTDATLVVKTPKLSKLLPDGGLPPLQ